MDTTPGSGVYSHVANGDPDLLFDRSVRTKARVMDGKLVLSAWLSDDTLGPTGFVKIHDMGMEVACSLDTLTILSAEAEMKSHPHGVCPLLLPDAQSLVGLTITTGFFNELRKRMGGVRGCNHMHTLAQSIGTVAALTFAARHVHAHPAMAQLPKPDYFRVTMAEAPGVVNSCRVWREDGEIVAELRRLNDESPLPSVDNLE